MTNQDIAIAQLVMAALVTTANVVLTALTYRYVKLTGGMLEHVRSAQGASITIDIGFDGHSAYLNVKNVGASAATNIVFEELSGLEWATLSGIDEIRERGISYLPSGRTLSFGIGFPMWAKIKDQPMVTVALRYESDGSARRREFLIDMMQYSGTSVNTAPADRIVDAINRLRDSQRRPGGVFAHFLKAPTKVCVECAESIPLAARICSHCGSAQRSDVKKQSTNIPSEESTEPDHELQSESGGDVVDSEADSSDVVTDAINRVCDQVGDQDNDFVTAAARRVLEKTEW